MYFSLAAFLKLFPITTRFAISAFVSFSICFFCSVITVSNLTLQGRNCSFNFIYFIVNIVNLSVYCSKFSLFNSRSNFFFFFIVLKSCILFWIGSNWRATCLLCNFYFARLKNMWSQTTLWAIKELLCKFSTIMLALLLKPLSTWD